MSRKHRRQASAAGGIALVDVLANAVAIALVLIVTTLTREMQEEQERENQERQFSVVMARRLATVLTFQDFPVSTVYTLHDYAECDRRRENGELMPTLELYDTHVRIRDTKEEVRREELLDENNPIERYIKSLPEGSRIRFDMHAVHQYYLTASLLIENGYGVPPHFHFISPLAEPPSAQPYEPMVQFGNEAEPERDSWLQRFLQDDRKPQRQSTQSLLPQGVRLRRHEQLSNPLLPPSPSLQGASSSQGTGLEIDSSSPRSSGTQLGPIPSGGKVDDPTLGEAGAPNSHTAQEVKVGDLEVDDQTLKDSDDQLASGSPIASNEERAENHSVAKSNPLSSESAPSSSESAPSQAAAAPQQTQGIELSTGPSIEFGDGKGRSGKESEAASGPLPRPSRGGDSTLTLTSPIDRGNRSDSMMVSLDIGQNAGNYAEIRQYYSGMFTALSSEALRRINVDEATLAGTDSTRIGVKTSEDLVTQLTFRVILSNLEPESRPDNQKQTPITTSDDELTQERLRQREVQRLAPVSPTEVAKLRSYAPIFESIITTMRSTVSEGPPPPLRLNWDEVKSEPRLLIGLNKPLVDVSVRATPEFLPRPRQGQVSLLVRPEPFPAGGWPVQLRTKSIVSVLAEPVFEGKSGVWMQVMISDPLGLAIYKGYVLAYREHGAISLPFEVNEIEIDGRRPVVPVISQERNQRRSHLLAYAITFVALLAALFKTR